MKKKIILNKTGVEQTIRNLSEQIIRSTDNAKNIVLIGIQTRGVPLARRIAQSIYAKTGREIPVGVLDITLYRDDVHSIALQPLIKETELPLDLSDHVVILVDDVLFTGRSIRAALDQLMDFGRPRAVRLCILIDRGHREFPIQPDYIGKIIPTAKAEDVIVMLREVDGQDQVIVSGRAQLKKKRSVKQG